MATKKETVGITLPPIDVRVMEVTLVGETPLIVHAWSQKARLEMLNKQMKKASGKKEAKDPRRDFEESLYRLPDDGYGFPSVAFKSAAITAITSVGGVTKVGGRQAFHVLGSDVEITGAFDGTKMRLNLIRIEGSEPTMREDPCRVGMGTADLRYRGEFWPWHATVIVRYAADVLSEEQILNLFNRAGFGVGVGEWRPEKDGMNGMFRVATEADLDAIAASDRRAA